MNADLTYSSFHLVYEIPRITFLLFAFRRSRPMTIGTGDRRSCPDDRERVSVVIREGKDDSEEDDNIIDRRCHLG